MIHRRKRLDAVREQFVQQPIVEIETFRVWRTCSFRKNTRPCNREPIRLRAQRLHQSNVVLVAMKMLVGVVGITAVLDRAGSMGVTVPDRLTPTVLSDGAFDLIGRCCRSPQKAVREAEASVCRIGCLVRVGLTGLGWLGRYSKGQRSRNSRKMAPGQSFEHHGFTFWS